MDEEVPVQVDYEKSMFSIWSHDGHLETDQSGTQHYNAIFIIAQKQPKNCYTSKYFRLTSFHTSHNNSQLITVIRFLTPLNLVIFNGRQSVHEKLLKATSRYLIR